MQTLNYTITINAPVSIVRDTMLNHPTYEQRTEPFAAGSTYLGSREQGSNIKFTDPNQEAGMLSTIAENKLHEFLSIKHIGEFSTNKETGQEEQKLFPWGEYSHENYTFTTTSTGTQVDVFLDKMPDEYVDMMNEARPKALQILKKLCEK